MKMSLTVYSSGRRQELDGEDSRRQGPPKVYVSHGLQRPSGGPSSDGSSDRAGCHAFSRLQPLCNLSVEHKMKMQIRFINHTPSSAVHTKLDATLPHAVFIGLATGEGQQKSWKGIR